MLKITKYLTPCNFTKMTNKKIEYLVIHYVGAVSSAKNNAVYYHSKRAASAHYFVDETTIYQVVEDTDRAWHCGGGLQGSTGTHPYFRICTNANSIGIEMCLDKVMHISDKTIDNVADLVQYLMKKYDIPVKNVITHFQVTGKLCPAMYVDPDKWDELKKILVGAKVATPVKIIVKSPIVATTPKLSNPTKKWVKSLQVTLNKLGYKDSDGKKLTEDGLVGARTKSACKSLEEGDRNALVGLMQERLNELGFNAGTVDNDFGDKGVKAVIQMKKVFMGAKNPTGVLGNLSWDVLLGTYKS